MWNSYPLKPFPPDYGSARAIVPLWHLGGFGYEYHKKYRNEIGIQTNTEAYIQSLVLKKTLESIYFERKRGLEEEDRHNEVNTLVNKITEASTKVKLANTK